MKRDGNIVMQLPVYDTGKIDVPKRMLDALGVDKTVNTRFSPKNNIILVEINDAAALAGSVPDFHALINSYSGINGVLVIARSNSDDFDFSLPVFLALGRYN